MSGTSFHEIVPAGEDDRIVLVEHRIVDRSRRGAGRCRRGASKGILPVRAACHRPHGLREAHTFQASRRSIDNRAIENELRQTAIV